MGPGAAAGCGWGWKREKKATVDSSLRRVFIVLISASTPVSRAFVTSCSSSTSFSHRTSTFASCCRLKSLTLILQAAVVYRRLEGAWASSLASVLEGEKGASVDLSLRRVFSALI